MIIKKIKWFYIWAGLHLLKKGLHYRIEGDGNQWLQPYHTFSDPVNRMKWILDYSTGKKILHVGFADAPFTKDKIESGGLLHMQLKNKAAFLYGIDTNDEAVNLYRSMTNDLYVHTGTVDQITDERINDIELVIVGEVLEHILDPATLINQLQEKLKKGQQLLVTVPNYLSFDSISAGLHNTESIHPDHHWYFSPYTLANKFSAEHWDKKNLLFAYYGEKKPNFIESSFPALADCIILVLEKI